MKCERCGAETERRGNNQKYCPKCAVENRNEYAEQWRESHRAIRRERHCRECGALVGAYQSYCSKCRAEHERVYQREYKRRIRAKK